jgi:hypothetical protein
VRRRIAGEYGAARDAAEAIIMGAYAWRLAAIGVTLERNEAAAARRALLFERDACLTASRAQLRAAQAARQRSEIGTLVAAASDERSRRRMIARAFHVAATHTVAGSVPIALNAKRTPAGRPFLVRRFSTGHLRP